MELLQIHAPTQQMPTIYITVSEHSEASALLSLSGVSWYDGGHSCLSPQVDATWNGLASTVS